MSAKRYQLNIVKSDGTIKTCYFTIPRFIGTYKLKFVLSDFKEIDAGNITVDDTEHTYNLKITLSDGSTITSGTIVTPVGVTKLTFESASWDEIAEISKSGVASEHFAVGDEKTIRLSTGEEITLVILGFNHDYLSNGSGKAGMTIGMKNLLADTYKMNSSRINTGWGSSDMRSPTLTTLFSQLPSDLQGVIKQVSKKGLQGGNTTIGTSINKLWLLAKVEVDGTTQLGYVGEGEQYEYWKNNIDTIKYLSNGSGGANGWWLRTPSKTNKTSFFMVSSSGSTGVTDYANSENGVSFCFCV